MFACAMSIDLHLPECRSLKAKRSVVKPLVEGLRRRYQVAAAEVGHTGSWQRATIGVAVVSGSQRHASDILDEVERFVWSHPEVQVLSASRAWLEDPG